MFWQIYCARVAGQHDLYTTPLGKCLCGSGLVFLVYTNRRGQRKLAAAKQWVRVAFSGHRCSNYAEPGPYFRLSKHVEMRVFCGIQSVGVGSISGGYCVGLLLLGYLDY